VTKDRSLAAHYEETVALTEAGAEILTRSTEPAAGTAAKELSYA